MARNIFKHLEDFFRPKSSTFRTRAPRNYIEPSSAEIKEMADVVGVSTYSEDLVRDLTNIAAGGTIVPPDFYEAQVREIAEKTLGKPNRLGDYRLSIPKGNEKVTSDRQEALENHFEWLMQSHSAVSDFLGSVDIGQFTGSTPLERSLNLLKVMAAMKGGKGDESQGVPLPIFSDGDPESSGRSLADTIQGVMESTKQLSEQEKELMFGEGDLSAEDIAEGLLESPDNEIILRIGREMDQLTNLSIHRRIEELPDLAGDDSRIRPIKDETEIALLMSEEWATFVESPEYWLYRVLTGDAQVREPVRVVEKRKAILLLVDSSGSMNGPKHYKASGVVMHFLKSVMDDIATVYIMLYDSRVGKSWKATDKESAIEVMQEFRKKNFSGGSTETGDAIKYAVKFINTEMAKDGSTLYDPEILVLTDDDSSVNGVRLEDLCGIRLHGFAIQSNNPGLIKLAKDSGGYGVEQF